MLESDYTFNLDRFLEGARRTAKSLEEDFIVTDRETGSNPGGCGLIMGRLVEIISDFRAGNGARWENR